MTDDRKTEENGRKKDKKIKKSGFLRKILKIGVVGNSEKCDFIGLLCFWAKIGGKNERFFALFCTFFAKMCAF